MSLSAPRTILLVEDDRQLQHVLAEALHQSGFIVLAEHDGDWALTTFLQRPVDLLLTDGLLPRRNGFQLAEDIRKHVKGRKLPIVFISGVYPASKSKQKLEERIGPVEWADKPVEPSRIVALCRRALQIPEAPDDPSYRRRQLSRARAETAHLKGLSSIADLAELKSVESESQVRFRGALQVRGNLRETKLAEVLSELHRWRASGALLVHSGPVKKLVYLREGAPFFVRSNVLSETLGQLLVRERLITLRECEESLARSRESKSMQGTELIKLGCISPSNLAYALQLQLEQKLFDLFCWDDGEYRFNPQAPMPEAQIALEMTPARVLLEGVKRTYDGERVRAALGEVASCRVQFTDDPLDRFQDMGLEEDEAQLYGLIDGKRTVGDLLAVAALGRLSMDDGRRLLYALRCANMIHFAAPDAAPAPEEGPGQRAPQAPPVAELPERALAEPELLQRQQVQRLAARAQDLRRGTLFEALGVGHGAGEFEIRNAFAALARESHPDRLGPDPTREARALTEEIFRQLSLAQDTLLNRERRTGYELELRKGRPRSDGDAVDRILAAEHRFREGEVLLTSGDASRARTAFEEATQLYPDQAEFYACLGWATWLEQRSADAALALIAKALALNPRIDRAYVFRGHIARALGQAREAESEFEKALLCNPACAEALLELRLTRKP